MASDYPVVVYGASGYTGRLVMEHLRDLSVPFIAAGRNREKIEKACSIVPGIEDARYEIRVVDNDVDELVKLFSGRRVVCNTVGPFMRFGMPVVEAALRAGVHYLDTTGEQHWVVKLRNEYGREFAKAGLALIPSMSYMYGGSEIGARFCLDTPGVDTLDLTEVAQAVPTVASAQTILDAVRHPAYYLQDNELVRYRGVRAHRQNADGVLSRHRDQRHRDAVQPGAQGVELGRYVQPHLVRRRWPRAQLQDVGRDVEPGTLQEGA